MKYNRAWMIVECIFIAGLAIMITIFRPGAHRIFQIIVLTPIGVVIGIGASGREDVKRQTSATNNKRSRSFAEALFGTGFGLLVGLFLGYPIGFLGMVFVAILGAGLGLLLGPFFANFLGLFFGSIIGLALGYIIFEPFVGIIGLFIGAGLGHWIHKKEKKIDMIDRSKLEVQKGFELESAQESASSSSSQVKSKESALSPSQNIDATQMSSKKKNKLREEISSLHDRSKYINTSDIEKAIDEDNLNQAEILLEKRKEKAETMEEIEDEINTIKKEEEMIDIRNIESFLDDGEVEKAERELEELKQSYEEYKETIGGLEKLDNRIASLSNRLADGEIDAEVFRDAKEGIDQQKYELENKLKELRREIIHEDYEKPF